ncbi:MAG: type III secretion system export apparatus subunit SctS [Burkholderiales bacterium]|nr:type III secretion system export apparatus subunit SctS [Burkholderiales bacterium]
MVLDGNITYLAKHGLLLSLFLSLPVVVSVALIGLLVSMIQALTQIQDQTFSFAIKLFIVIAVIYLTVDWMAQQLYNYAKLLYQYIG